MVNPFKEVNWNPSTRERRKFAWSLVIGFPCVAVMVLLVGFLSGKGWNVSLAFKVGGIGAAVGLVFLAVPKITRPFYVLWYGFACTIGIVVSNVLLSAFYYFVVMPIGLSLRSLGKCPLRKEPDKRSPTYWVEAEQVNDPKRYFKQF